MVGENGSCFLGAREKNTCEASVSGQVISETPTRIEFSFNPFCFFWRQNFAFIWHCLPALARRDWETPSAMERPLPLSLIILL